MDLVRRHESIYKQAGAVHGCALCIQDEDGGARILQFVEDVGRHNAVDAIAGWMWSEGIEGSDKIFYTTGRLTSEMVIKCAQMDIPVLLSRSGLTGDGPSDCRAGRHHDDRPLPGQALSALHRPRAIHFRQPRHDAPSRSGRSRMRPH